jgi:hypothetical protein
MRNSVIVKFTVAALAASWLSGCGMSDDKLARVLVAPGQYVTYRCVDIAERVKSIAGRQRELKALMAKAGPSAGGRLVSATTYRPEYLNLHGEMLDLRRTARDKKCNFVPSEETSATAAPTPPRARHSGTR